MPHPSGKRQMARIKQRAQLSIVACMRFMCVISSMAAMIPSTVPKPESMPSMSSMKKKSRLQKFDPGISFTASVKAIKTNP